MSNKRFAFQSCPENKARVKPIYSTRCHPKNIYLLLPRTLECPSAGQGESVTCSSAWETATLRVPPAANVSSLPRPPGLIGRRRGRKGIARACVQRDWNVIQPPSRKGMIPDAELIATNHHDDMTNPPRRWDPVRTPAPDTYQESFKRQNDRMRPLSLIELRRYTTALRCVDPVTRMLDISALKPRKIVPQSWLNYRANDAPVVAILHQLADMAPQTGSTSVSYLPSNGKRTLFTLFCWLKDLKLKTVRNS